MAREIQITPRRILYAQKKEGELYKNLMAISNEKQEEITQLIQVTLKDMKDNLVEKAGDYCYQGVTLSDSEEIKSAQSVHIATVEIQNLVLSSLSDSVASQLVKSVDCLQDTFVGTLQRCLESLEKNCQDQEGSLLASSAVKQDLTETDLHLQILSAAYNVELTTSSSSSVLHSFIERLRKLLHGLQLPWTQAPRLDSEWRKRVATEMLNSLNAARLARSISAQFRDKVRSSHEAFQAAMHSLESHYTGHLVRTEEQRVAIRKLHAPRLARLSLESTSLSDMVQYGMPQLGKEIGRGQYGVVFSCESWSGKGPCAVKSVVPPDEKHWNDLAMEFYYTRTIPDHKHIVRLHGLVVDHMYGGGCSPAVLLIMDHLTRDLYCGLRAGLKWLTRLQIAIDVAEGIRYLHSQGLIRGGQDAGLASDCGELMGRRGPLSNLNEQMQRRGPVRDHDEQMGRGGLTSECDEHMGRGGSANYRNGWIGRGGPLDINNRAKLTDLGFCIPEAMMSGSIVGTPVHMAPELLSGHYDSSVDVYAFGILFWYICAGHVRLPYVFERFQNKEQLWTSVRKG
uniref:(California timema) hypothetical protein n=1 Tax=Timema californicum TaxID=61474 RepID=A0A7R9P5X2_TIMCA|nr:unnamed protein product [Timema californicum]